MVDDAFASASPAIFDRARPPQPTLAEVLRERDESAANNPNATATAQGEISGTETRTRFQVDDSEDANGRSGSLSADRAEARIADRAANENDGNFIPQQPEGDALPGQPGAPGRLASETARIAQLAQADTANSTELTAGERLRGLRIFEDAVSRFQPSLSPGSLTDVRQAEADAAAAQQARSTQVEFGTTVDSPTIQAAREREAVEEAEILAQDAEAADEAPADRTAAVANDIDGDGRDSAVNQNEALQQVRSGDQFSLTV